MEELKIDNKTIFPLPEEYEKDLTFPLFKRDNYIKEYFEKTLKEFKYTKKLNFKNLSPFNHVIEDVMHSLLDIVKNKNEISIKFIIFSKNSPNSFLDFKTMNENFEKFEIENIDTNDILNDIMNNKKTIIRLYCCIKYFKYLQRIHWIYKDIYYNKKKLKEWRKNNLIEYRNYLKQCYEIIKYNHDDEYFNKLLNSYFGILGI
jgi:hypothetical protein